MKICFNQNNILEDWFPIGSTIWSRCRKEINNDPYFLDYIDISEQSCISYNQYNGRKYNLYVRFNGVYSVIPNIFTEVYELEKLDFLKSKVDEYLIRLTKINCFL